MMKNGKKSVKEYWKDDSEKLNRKDNTQVVQLLNSFIHNGPNGKHFSMVFEIMGVTLLEIIKRYKYKGIPLPYVRIIAKQVLIGLDYLHRMCGIVHTDLKPENVLVCLTKEELIEIYKNGYLDTSKKKKKKDSNANNNEINKIQEKEDLDKIPATKKKKADRKKLQKLIKKEV